MKYSLTQAFLQFPPVFIFQVSIFNNAKSESRLSLSNRGGDSDGGPSVHSGHSVHSAHMQHGHPSMGGPATMHELRPQEIRSIGQSGAQALRSSQHAQYRRDVPADVGGAGGQQDDSSSTGSERYERDVAILNHCFDDIERFIARLQNAATAYKELEKRRKGKKGSNKANKKDMGGELNWSIATTMSSLPEVKLRNGNEK